MRHHEGRERDDRDWKRLENQLVSNRGIKDLETISG
jgi:hypothetical protein